jgi:hypothetical protein
MGTNSRDNNGRGLCVREIHIVHFEFIDEWQRLMNYHNGASTYGQYLLRLAK